MHLFSSVIESWAIGLTVYLSLAVVTRWLKKWVRGV